MYVYIYIYIYIYTCIHRQMPSEDLTRRQKASSKPSSGGPLCANHRHVCLHTCKYIRMCIYTYSYIYISLSLYVYICVYIYIYTCVYIYIYIYICIMHAGPEFSGSAMPQRCARREVRESIRSISEMSSCFFGPRPWHIEI